MAMSISKGDKELEKAITSLFIGIEALERSLGLLNRKNPRIHRSTLDREMGRMDERTSWIKNNRYPIFSKSAQAVGEDQVELPAGLGWHFFQVTALPSLKEYMEEEEISKFKALILEKSRRFISFRRRPGLFPAVYRFL